MCAKVKCQKGKDHQFQSIPQLHQSKCHLLFRGRNLNHAQLIIRCYRRRRRCLRRLQPEMIAFAC